MNRALLHLAVLAGVLLVACPAPPSVPEPVEPAEPRVPPDPHAERTVLPTPEGPWEGQGRTWIEKVGASPRDYPGPAALVSVARAVPGGLTLAPDVRADGFDGCAGGGGEDWMGAAAVLPIGDGGGCAGLAACTEALDRLLEQRVSLVAALGGSDEVADALARHTRTRVGRTKVRQHFAVTLPSRLAPGIGARLGDAHAGVIRTGAFLLAERRELMLLNRTVRASGRRVLLGFPFGRASEAGSDRELALLGMHLASGGGLWVEGGARLPDRLERARAALRRRPELVHRSDARVGVLVDPGELEASALVELTGTLEAVRIPWDVVLQPTEAGWPDQHEGERVSAYAALALPRAALLSEELVGLLAGASSPRWILLRPSDPAAPAARERLDAAGIPHVTVGKGMSGVVSLPEELGWVITDLPAPVWVGRTKAPHRGLVVHHFVNRARDRRGRSVPVAASTLELPAGGAGAGGRCEAEWLVPDEDLQQAVPCRVGPHGRFAVDLPAFATWAVLTVRARPFDRSASFGEAPLRLAETTEGWDGGTLQLMVPFWPPGQVLSLSLPEEFGGGVAHVLEGMDSAVEQWSPRGARFVSSSPDLQIIRELRTGLDSVDVTLTLENLGDEPIPEVSAVVCLASDGVTVVPDSGHDTTYFVDQNHTLTLLAGVPTDSGDPLFREHRGHSLPLTIVESVDGRWAMASGFEGGRGVGGNGNRAGVCVHSRPFFGVLEPGVPKSLRGTFYVTQDEPAAIVRRWTAAHGEPERYPGGDDRWRGPCE